MAVVVRERSEHGTYEVQRVMVASKRVEMKIHTTLLLNYRL